ncbi:MAG: FHA domain-containing protein [Clostridia bacterium]|nr:FHA domain-containing protein [Clostridia bacterium]
MYTAMIIVGFIAIGFSFGILAMEKRERHDYYKGCFDAAITLVAPNREREDTYINLSTSHYTIGRRKRRSDIYLGNDDLSISKEHAELIFNGETFVIVPSTFHLPEKNSHLKRKIFVTTPVETEEGTEYQKIQVPPEGYALKYGDTIHIGIKTLKYTKRIPRRNKEAV